MIGEAEDVRAIIGLPSLRKMKKKKKPTIIHNFGRRIRGSSKEVTPGPPLTYFPGRGEGGKGGRGGPGVTSLFEPK